MDSNDASIYAYIRKLESELKATHRAAEEAARAAEEAEKQNIYLKKCLLDRQKSYDRISVLFNSYIPSESYTIDIQHHIYDAGGRPTNYDELIIGRQQRVQDFVNHLNSVRTSLVRSPPFSGKSWMCYALSTYLSRLGKNVYALSLLLYDGTEDLDNFFLSNIQISLSDLRKQSENDIVYLLLDEAQTLYSLPDSHPIWRCIKESIESSESNLRIMLFSSYGERPGAGHYSTPIAFPDDNILSLDSLQMNEEDCVEMFGNYNKLTGDILPIPLRIQQEILSICNYLIGLVRRTVFLMYRYLHSQWKIQLSVPGNKDSTLKTQTHYDDLLYNYLYSCNYYVGISDCRFVPDRNYSDIEQSLFRSLLVRSSLPYASTLAIYGDTLKAFLKHGLLVNVDDMIQFAAPAVRFMVIRKVLRVVGSPNTIVNTNTLKQGGLFQFITRVIRYMRPSYLRHELASGTNHCPLERIWQMEFYTASSYILHPDEFVIADFDDRFTRQQNESRKYLDFYVNHELKWALEFLREGNDIPGHLGRFQHGGEYSHIMSRISEYFVLDFRSIHKNIRDDFGPNVVHACYSDDFSFVYLRGGGQSMVYSIPLLGDFKGELKIT